MPKDLSPEIQASLKSLLDHFDKEDTGVRERQIRKWKQLKLYWDSFQRVWWSQTAHDWRYHDPSQSENDNDAAAYDKPINVFRAYLESIIAALSISVPSLKCFPDDADDPLDISTAKAGDKIVELIFKHNDAPLLWVHALYIYCTEGLIAAHHYTKEDKTFGTYVSKKYGDVDEEIDSRVCAVCGTKLSDLLEHDEETEDLLEDKQDPNFCPTCKTIVAPQLSKTSIKVRKFIGSEDLPKSRQCIEIYGGLFVKVPNYARNQSECPYLIYSHDTHYSNAITRFEHLRGKFPAKITAASIDTGDRNPYERWGRLSNQYLGDYPNSTVTIRDAWFRPWTYSILEEDRCKELRKKFPNGVRVTYVNDDFGEAEDEDLDDHWTLSANPLSDYIHHEPLGSLLTSVQEVTNDVVSLALQTMEHGIPQTFFSPDFLNAEAYKNLEAAPGMLIEGKSVTGKSMSDGFHEVRTAVLSREFESLLQRFQEMGQLVSGALPSLFGGSSGNSSKTAAQYSMSRAQALQRLQTPHKMLTIWWKNLFSKVVPAYIKDVAEDERIVNKDPATGNFVNILISKAELAGKIGSVELEASENIPLTYAQQNDMVMKLLTSGNMEMLQALMTPENLPMLAQTIGLQGFVLPGKDDKEKQYEEIQILVSTQPLMNQSVDPMTGMPIEIPMPSVEVDPLVDNHMLEADIIRRWCISDRGRQVKKMNPAGYQNVLLHLQQHVMNMQPVMPANNNESSPNNKENDNGRTNESAPTIQ